MNATVMSEFEDARALCGAAPLSGDFPAGVDVRDGADFERLEAEVRKMDADGPSAVDWAKVSSLSLQILSSQSKDILVASWATYGLFRTESYQGLAVGLGILRGMVDAHWDGLFPPFKRERARVNAIDWLIGRVSPAVADASPQQSDEPAVLAAYDALEDLDRLLGAKLLKEQAALGELFRALRPHRDEARRAVAARAEEAARAAEQAAARAAAAETAGGAAAPSPTAVSAAPTVAPSGVETGDWASFADRLPDMLRQTAAAQRAASPMNPQAYLLNRLGSWLRFDELPPNEGGRTMVPPPADGIAAIEAKIAAGEHADVINLAEELAWTAPFWLDSHRHAATALEKMGAAMAPAAATVRAAMAMLFTRYPAIAELQFSDGRPFGDNDTRAWAAVGAGSAPSRDLADAAVAEANKSLGAGQVQTAFETLARALDGAEGGRERLLCQLAQARFCLDRGFVNVAIPLLDHLDALVVERDLEAWEPKLALRVAELRYRAISHSDAIQLDEIRRQTALEQLRLRVARLDIGVASQLSRN